MLANNIKLLVGLGNPGKEYSRNRHNIGFMAIDEIADSYGFSSFKTKFSGEISDKEIAGHKVVLLKPQTFMNNSGASVLQVKAFYKIALDDIIVLHDELDLEPNKIRIKTGGGSAGHNGLKSIDASIGKDYVRLRMGIGKPPLKEQVHGYVLGNFTNTEMEWVKKLNGLIADDLETLIAARYTDFASRVASALKDKPESD